MVAPVRAVGGRKRRVAAACALALTLLSACGGGERQDVNEPEGTFTVDVTRATFPTEQRLASKAQLAITVRNTGVKAVPNVAVTVQPGNGVSGGGSATSGNAAAFAETSDQPGLADPSRPVWVLDGGPRGGTTAYVNTWALGELAPGQEKTFLWNVTAVKAGTHTIKYRVAGGLNGKAKAQLSTGEPPEGAFTVKISDAPADARVGPNDEVIITPRQASP